VLLVVSADALPAERLAAALGLTAYEADQRVRAGGPFLHRILPPAEAEIEAARLGDAGLPVVAIDEADVRAADPHRVAGGSWRGSDLALRAGEEIVVRPDDVLLVVRGPIARERAAALQIRRVRTDVPVSGYRIHVHRRSETRPAELDPEDFDFGPGGPVAGSPLVELIGWLERLAPGAPRDDRFRRLPVALAPAEPPRGALADALGAGRRPGRAGEDVLLDNVGQFRFYSAWRAALERRRP
jgi:hypothetical protein